MPNRGIDLRTRMLMEKHGYAEKVHPAIMKQFMRDRAEMIRRKGEGRDKILAHINPEEARFLQHHSGMDINPHTGLPQFGNAVKKIGNSIKRVFGKKEIDPVTGEVRRTGIRKTAHNVGHGIEKKLRPLTKAALPILGSLAGGYFAPGLMGNVMGGMIGGGLSSQSHPLDHMLGGALVGAGTNYMAPRLGEMFGVSPHSTMGNVLGMGNRGAGSALLDSGAGSLESLQNLGSSSSGGIMNTIFNGIAEKPLDAALLATTIAGTLGSKSKVPNEPSMSEHMASIDMGSRPEDRHRKVKPSNRQYIQPPEGYDPTIHGEHLYFGEEPEIEYYADGGSVAGQSTNSPQQPQQQQQQAPGQLPTPGVMTNQNPLMASRGVIAPSMQSSSVAQPGFDVGNYVQTMMGLPVPGQTSAAGAPSQPAQTPQFARQDNSQQDTSGNPIVKAKRGGRFASGGPVMGATGGQADVRPDRIRPGSYILNATDISLLGDGNTDNGMHKAHKMVDKFMRSGITSDYMSDHSNHKHIDVMLSDGEYKVPAEVVTAIGKGSNDRGAKMLDKARKKLRKQKGVKAILPPKSKDFMSYLR